MRYLLFIFNLYLLVLPCLPCSDVDSCVTESISTISFQKENNSKEKHREEHKDDNCSPFCHCACCVSTSFYFVSTAEKNVLHYFIEKNYTAQPVQVISNNYSAIWQPPKQIFI